MFKIDANGICIVHGIALGVDGNEKILKIDAHTLGLTDEKVLELQQKNQANYHEHFDI